MNEEKVRVELKIGNPENPELHVIWMAPKSCIDYLYERWGLKPPPPPEPVAVAPKVSTSTSEW
jgi:hypothetical protein